MPHTRAHKTGHIEKPQFYPGPPEDRAPHGGPAGLRQPGRFADHWRATSSLKRPVHSPKPGSGPGAGWLSAPPGRPGSGPKSSESLEIGARPGAETEVEIDQPTPARSFIAPG